MSIERQMRAPVEVRKEGRRRLVIGFAGLAAMLLLVMLSSWLTSAARREAAIAKMQAEAAGISSPGGAVQGSPLSDLGAGAQTSTPAPTSNAAPQQRPNNGAMVVPDLEPDPQLEASEQRR